MPQEGINKIASREVLRFEEIERFVRLSTHWGIDKIRITGGEPLVRKDIVRLIRMLSEIRGINDISMTTNGLLLTKFAYELKRAGLKRVNISLDTLKKDRFMKITGFNELDNVLDGIERAKEEGLNPIKINAVIIKGINDDEVIEFARLTLNEPLIVRFIECLPILNNYQFVPNNKIKQAIEGEFGKLEELKGIVEANHGPADNFQIRNSLGAIGFISALSNPFCDRCNRLRLTSTGLLRSCLLSDFEIDFKKTLKEGTDAEIRALFELAIKNKPKLPKSFGYLQPEAHNVNFNTCHMFSIGG